MRARITDSSALRNISPAQITAYLRGRGARQVGELSGRAAIWSWQDEEFLVPVAVKFGDYAYRVADILAALEKIEKRSQLAIVADMRLSDFDVVRIGCFPQEGEGETLGLAQAVDFLGHARDLLMAATIAAAHKVCYRDGTSRLAEEFLKSVRIAWGECCCCAVRLVVPIEPARENVDAPFEKYALYAQSVVPTLHESLEALYLTAQKTSQDGSIEDFAKAAARGLTANMCDALAGMYMDLGAKRLELQFAYSANRCQPRPCARICLETASILLIKSASRAIRAKKSKARA